MSLLRRISKQPPSDENDGESPLFDSPKKPLQAEISDLLQLSSAWSVWPALCQFTTLRRLAESVSLSAAPNYPVGAMAVISTDGTLYADPTRLAPAGTWMFVLAHLLAHLGLRHKPTADSALLAAQEVAANNFLVELGLYPPPDVAVPLDPTLGTDADAIVAYWSRKALTPLTGWASPAGPEMPDLIAPKTTPRTALKADDWAMLLTQGLLANVPSLPLDRTRYAPWVTVGMSKARQALNYFILNFPLLSALAAHFQVIEDRDVVQSMGIEVAAVLAERMEIFVNPDRRLSKAELQFVMAHEMLHVGLLHHRREEKRDHFVWNVACDFVINAWLKDLGVGEMPVGGLYDPAYFGMSAEQIYDRLIKDAEYVSVLATFRGRGTGDILPGGTRGGPRRIGAKVIDDNLAEELMRQGIEAHMNDKRGLLPAGLIEMITPAKERPPAWKIALTRWFDARFEPILPVRSYARQSRRQNATPDIPRPRYAVPQIPDGAGVFGVVLDTSGSMSAALLGRGLGAVAALARRYRIPKVRLVFCDVTPHDEGFVPIERLEQPMPVRGRGGTRLQPGVDLLHNLTDFPKDAPILVFTDGECDVLEINRPHAFLIPDGRKLPFAPVGPVFKLS